LRLRTPILGAICIRKVVLSLSGKTNWFAESETLYCWRILYDLLSKDGHDTYLEFTNVGLFDWGI
jgi:hypothetical protein